MRIAAVHRDKLNPHPRCRAPLSPRGLGVRAPVHPPATDVTHIRKGRLLRRLVHALVQVLRLLLDRALQSASALHGGGGRPCYAACVPRSGAYLPRAARPPLTRRLGSRLRTRQEPICLQHFLREDRDDDQCEQQTYEPEPAALLMRGVHISSGKQEPMRKRLSVRRAASGQSDQFRVWSTSLFFFIHGIISRSLAPTCSIGCSVVMRLFDNSVGAPARFSMMKSFAYSPL